MMKQIARATVISMLLATSAMATPVYYGDTDAAGFGHADMDTGYYIWNDESDDNSWHIRWTSTHTAPGNLVDWFGSIVFEGGGLVSSSSFLFESRGRYADDFDADFGLFSDEIEWVAATNDRGGVDGIDFRIDDTLDILEFNLGSSLFSDLKEVTSGSGVEGFDIYIGDSLATPDVFIFESRGRTYQSFEVSVPEPNNII
ncbi:MAG: hypothetical protein MI867_04300, partial [Pseudomonadales bacterium]|nr:hypothetical protein [Pseudomonadales bacterium]